MKNYGFSRAVAVTFAAAVIAGPISTMAATQAVDPLVALEDARFKAMVDRDVGALDKAIAADAIYIHANGILQTKAEYLKDVEEGRSRYRAIEAAERTVSKTGNLAITHALVRLHVGTDRTIIARTTGLYRRIGKGWQVVVWQSTPVTAVQTPPTQAPVAK